MEKIDGFVANCKKDKAVFKCCRQCLNKLYKKVYDNCIDCGIEKKTEREKEFNRCFVCFQNFKNM